MNSEERSGRKTGTTAAWLHLAGFMLWGAVLPAAQAVEPPMRHIRIEIADFYYPAASDQEGRSLLPGLLEGAVIEGRYSRYVSRRRLALTSCMTGVACFPDPHIRHYADRVDKTMKSSALRISAGPDRGAMRVDFSLPAKAGDSDLNAVIASFPLDVLWRLPSVKSYVDARLSKIASDKTVPSSTAPPYEADRRMTQALSVDIDGARAPDFTPWCVKDAVIHMPRAYHYAGLISLRVLETLPNGDTVPRPQTDCVKAGSDEAGRISRELESEREKSFHEFHDQ